jgi:4-alpha-methyl-delta7-sterol-4alpha-methyl oxidase
MRLGGDRSRVFEGLIAIYREPLFVLFPLVTVGVAIVSFAVFAAPLTWMAAADPPALRRFRIQRRRPRAQELVGPSVRSWVVNNVWMIAGIAAAWPLLRLSGVHAGPLPPWWVVAGQLLFFIYLDDFLYYWAHRALHTRWLYKRVHGWHHRIVTPWAVTGNYMHPLEYAMTGAVALVGPLLVGAHVVTLWLWFAFRQWEAAEGHCGYDLPWTPTHLLPFNDGATHHDVHHERVKGNYAGFLTLWDRVFGTFARGYAEELAARHAAA